MHVQYEVVYIYILCFHCFWLSLGFLLQTHMADLMHLGRSIFWFLTLDCEFGYMKSYTYYQPLEVRV